MKSVYTCLNNNSTQQFREEHKRLQNTAAPIYADNSCLLPPSPHPPSKSSTEFANLKPLMATKLHCTLHGLINLTLEISKIK